MATLPANPSAQYPRVRRAVRSQGQVLSALFFREAESRRGRSFALSYLASGIEPLMIAAVLGVLFALMSRQPTYGPSIMLFLGTGVFPVYLFIHTSMRMRQPLQIGAHRMRYPLETPLDHVLVHALLHLMTSSAVAILFFGTLYLFGVRSAIPQDGAMAVGALGSIYLLGVAMGIVNAVLARIVPIWEMIWPALARTELHFSGLFFVVAFMPPHVRAYFALNPLTHAINWFRRAFYPFYPDIVADKGYVLMTGLCLLTLGLLLEVGTRRYLVEKE